MDGFMTVKETAVRWGLTERRVQKMCSDGQIEGIQKFGNAWVIPKNAKRPVDGRMTSGEYKNWREKHTQKISRECVCGKGVKK